MNGRECGDRECLVVRLDFRSGVHGFARVKFPEDGERDTVRSGSGDFCDYTIGLKCRGFRMVGRVVSGDFRNNLDHASGLLTSFMKRVMIF